MDNFKETTLKGHIQLCELRYQSLEEKINAVEQRILVLETKMSSLKSEMSQGFADIRLLLEKQNNARTIQLIATIGTIATAIVSAVAYIITH